MKEEQNVKENVSQYLVSDCKEIFIEVGSEHRSNILV
jgi:hypothetical protein